MSSIISRFIRRRNNLCNRFIKEGDNINILVTGGSGFLGSHIVDKLLENNINVKIFDLKKPYQKNVEYIKGNITSMKQLKNAISDVDYVYHIAALSNINKVIENPVKAVDFNILGTTKILEVCRNSPQIKRVIFASSYFVNSGKGHLYTTTKEISEIICKNYHNMYGIPFTILRYGSIYGPRSRGEDVISIFVKRAIENKNLIIHGNGNQLRNFIYVEDAADGSHIVLDDKAKNKIYNIIEKQQITINEIIEIMKKQFDNIKIKYEKERFNDYKGSKFLNEINEIEKDFCWKPKIKIEEGIKKYIKWYKNE